MDKVEIINEMLAELQKRGLWQRYKDVAERLGMNRATISSAIHGHPNGCTQSFIFKLNEAYGSLFNPEWMISGKGFMLLADAEANAKPCSSTTIQQQNAENCTAVVGANDPDTVTVRLLQMKIETLEKENARLESEKEKLEAKCDELQQVIIKQLSKQ